MKTPITKCNIRVVAAREWKSQKGISYSQIFSIALSTTSPVEISEKNWADIKTSTMRTVKQTWIVSAMYIHSGKYLYLVNQRQNKYVNFSV